MFAKIEIRGIIEVVTGLHIGGSTAFSAIGAVDSPVVKDSLTNLPLIPGSSLKGKMRTLLAKQYNETVNVTYVDDAGTEQQVQGVRVTRSSETSTKHMLSDSKICFILTSQKCRL